ncbi:bifunctional Vps72-YL1 [Babesia duncani]|uniref:Bifunctional Vps72-YL1 n=1 Tax=Babesia duncani TaxID=323732 RepID=A0AAD9PP32_9APIC|nr:bifunctional Vps72-YL1 [Babesia duncani]
MCTRRWASVKKKMQNPERDSDASESEVEDLEDDVDASGSDGYGSENESDGSNGSDESDSGSDSSGESFDEMSVGVALELPKRATRGKKYSKLVGEELEKDNQFWGHETWAEDAIDEDYNCSEGEEQYRDSADSDFDETEDEGSDNHGDDDSNLEQRRRRPNVYIDPALLRSKRTRAAIARSRASKNVQARVVKKPAEPKTYEPLDVDRERRDTTRLKTEAVNRIEEMRTREPQKRRKIKIQRHKEYTREELMKNAKKIEEANTKSLMRLQAWEDERKRYTESKKQTYKGHYDIWICWNSLLSIVTTNTVTGEELVQTVDPKVVQEKPLELYMFTSGKVPDYYPQQALARQQLKATGNTMCPISGKRARYLDPQTRMPYYGVNEFRRLRMMYMDRICNLQAQGIEHLESKLLQLLSAISESHSSPPPGAASSF